VVRTANSHVTVQWESNPVADMIADSLLALLMSLQANPPPGFAQAMGGADGHHHHHHHHHQHHHHSHDTSQTTKSPSKMQTTVTSSSASAAGATATGAEEEKKPTATGESAASAIEVESAPAEPTPKPSVAALAQDVQWFLSHQFADVVLDSDRMVLSLTVHSVKVTIDMHTMAVECADAPTRSRVERALARITATLLPLPSHSALDVRLSLLALPLIDLKCSFQSVRPPQTLSLTSRDYRIDRELAIS
jgi:hypothetical protein